MTDEAYEKILSKITNLSDADYKRILSESQDMERDFQIMIAGFTNDILGCETRLSAAYNIASEQVFSKAYMVENSDQSSENGNCYQTGRSVSEHVNEFEDYECLAA